MIPKYSEEEMAAWTVRSWPGWGLMDFPTALKPLSTEPVTVASEELDHVLKKRGITTLVYVGYATDMCLIGYTGGLNDMVKKFGYRAVVLREATLATELADGQSGVEKTRQSLERIEREYAATASVAHFVAALSVSDSSPSSVFARVAGDGQPHCRIVLPDQPAFMETRAAHELAQIIARDTGAVAEIRPLSDPAGTSSELEILLGTPSSCPLVARSVRDMQDGIGDLPLAGPDGFAVQTLEQEGKKYLVVAGATPRAVFYAALYTAEQVFAPQGRASLVVAPTRISRTPALTERSPYCLGTSGAPIEYTLDDWKKIFDGFAREGINRVYFWWQSLYKPRSFPDRRTIGGGNGRLKLTNDDVNALARYAHQLGMTFLIGGGAFAWGGASALTDLHPEAAAKNASGMCPSNAKARALHNQFLLEMLEAIPEADGIWFEPRDEHGECKCDRCQKPVDSFGSKQYGQSEITWLKQFAKLLWASRPKAEIAWLIEVSKDTKMHTDDPAYFEAIRQIKDPRIQWVVVWGAWELSGPQGQKRPLPFFSRSHLHWNKPYRMSLDMIRATALRAADMGLLGYSPAWEVWFSAGLGDYYAGLIPYPMDLLPYELTAYAFREFTWEPAQSMDQFKAKMRRRYFGPDAPMPLVEDMVWMRQFVTDYSLTLTEFAGERAHWDGGYFPALNVPETIKNARAAETQPFDWKTYQLNQLETKLKQLRKIQRELLARVNEVDERVRAYEPQASRRGKAGLALMSRLIADTRRLNDKIKVADAELAAGLEQIAGAR